MYKCNNCKDARYLKQGKKMVQCPYCITEEKLLAAIKQAISDAKKDGKAELSIKLQAVLSFLPEYPVMAVLECEALDLPENFVIMIQDSFGIRPFMDVEYHKEGLTKLV